MVLAILTDEVRVAALLFAVAVATDFADGWVARRRGEASSFGGLADHAVDATFVSAGSAALAWTGALPAALPPLIAIAFVQYVLDSNLVRTKALRASALGRWNGIAYYAIVGVPIVRDALGVRWPASDVVRLAGWLLVATTLVSIADRLRAALRGRRSAAP